MRARFALLLLTCLLPMACGSVHITSVHGPGTLLAERRSDDSPDAEVTVFKVLPGRRGGDPQIQRSATRRVQRPLLGIHTADIEPGIARALRAPEWGGVFVERVEPGSAAEAGGLRTGDLLILVNDQQVHSRRALDALVANSLRPHEEARVVVERWSDAEDDARRERVELLVTPAARSVLDELTEAFRLRTAGGVLRLTGLQAAAVPADLATEIWGTSGGAILISGVVSGSPAYHAGFRSGDRVLRIDGSPAQNLDQLIGAVAVRALDRGIELPAEEMPGSTLPPAPDQGSVALEVEGPLGPHEGVLKLREDLDSVVDFSFPILFDYESTVDHSSWSFVDFIFQFGANSWHRYEPSETRAPATSSELSLLPFGMFEFDSSPTRSRTTLFWFVTWTNRS